MGQPRPWRSTSFVHGSQNRWWPHGTSAIRGSRCATRQTSHEVVAVSGWGGDGRYDGVCAGVSIISRIVAVNCLDLCSVAFAFENCNAFHTFKVPCFPIPHFPPRATWSRVFQSRLFHPSNLAPGVFQSCLFQSRVFSVPPETVSQLYTELSLNRIKTRRWG